MPGEYSRCFAFCLFSLEVCHYFNHARVHVLSQAQAFWTVDFFSYFVVFFQLMPVPGPVGGTFTEFLAGILRTIPVL